MKTKQADTEIRFPIVTAIDEAIAIFADDRKPENGNASHYYEVFVAESDDVEPITVAQIQFQDGPINEAGVNGLGNEALLAILIDRLECFQSSKYACIENEAALVDVRSALRVLNLRTTRRKAAGVEGTHATTEGEGMAGGDDYSDEDAY